MSLLDSVRVLGAMARISAPSLVRDGARRPPARQHRRARALVRPARRRAARYPLSMRAAPSRVPPGRAYVYMSNHQSHLDIPVLYATLPSPTIRMLAKKELFQIPLWGRGLRAAEFVEVDPLEPRARGALDRVAPRRSMRDGVSIYLAPEGTRSRDGRIGTLKKGGFHLALGTGRRSSRSPMRAARSISSRGAGRRCSAAGPFACGSARPDLRWSGRDLEGLMREVRDFLVAERRETRR